MKKKALVIEDPPEQQLLKKLNLNEVPVTIPCKPRHDSIPNRCFEDVAHQVADSGGAAVYGWKIWIWPKMLAEATFHAVWQARDGGLLDVSVPDDGADSVLFIPDPTRSYNGDRVTTVRVALWDHNLVHEYIQASADLAEQELDLSVGTILSELYHRKGSLLRKLQSFPGGRDNWPRNY